MPETGIISNLKDLQVFAITINHFIIVVTVNSSEKKTWGPSRPKA